MLALVFLSQVLELLTLDRCQGLEKERHTAENITKWTDEALEAIGLTAEGLLGSRRLRSDGCGG